MKTVDEWAAEQCGVEFKQTWKGRVWYLNGKLHENDEWTIKDPRCREIVREHFKIWTAYGPIGFDRMGWQACTAYNKLTNYHGNTIDEAEIACITAIYEAEMTAVNEASNGCIVADSEGNAVPFDIEINTEE